MEPELDRPNLEAHREKLSQLIRQGGSLSNVSPHATVNQDAWFDPEGPTEERALLHGQIHEEVLAGRPELAYEHRAIILAGPPGAGKSTALRAELGADEARWLVIDPDKIKESLLRRAIADGSYESRIKPPEVHALESRGERFTPLEHASLVHRESSDLSEDIRRRAISSGGNIVIDSSLMWDDHRDKLARELTEAGYSVDVIDVECSFPVAEARCEHRWREGVEAARKDPDHLGERLVPSDYLRSMYPDGPNAPTRCENNARILAETCPSVTSYKVFRVDHPGAKPRLETHLERTSPGAALTAPPPQAVPTVKLGARETARHLSAHHAAARQRPGHGR